MNDSINNVDSNISNLKETVSFGLDEVNQHLTEIENTNKNVSDFVDNLKDIESETFQNDIQKSFSILDNVLSEFGTFKDNLSNQYKSVVDLGTTANAILNGGFTSIFSSHSSTVIECKQSFILDFTSIGATVMNIEIDPCYFSSQMRSILYPIFYIVFMVWIFSFSISLFRGVL
jgi:hypothetical protein